MPELEAVVEQKTAGFVDSSYTQARRKARIEKEEKELEELMKAQGGDSDGTEEQEESNGEGLDERQVQTKGRAKQEEANAEGEASEEDDADLSPEEKSFKKRYGDLRRHFANKEKEWEERFTALESKQDKAGIRAPKSDEDIEQWAAKYPDVASIVETIAQKKAQELFSKAEGALTKFEEAQYEAERTQAENKIRKAHSDFDELRSSDEFHDWASEQPKWVQDALYENSDDPASVIRVIDLYKVDSGKTPSDYKRKAKDAAKTVAKGARTKVDADGTEGVFRESQVAKMSVREYEANSTAIDEAIRTGKFVYDLSGGAR